MQEIEKLKKDENPLAELINLELQNLKQHFPFIPEKYDNLLALDIETSPKEEFKQEEDAALNYFKGKIDLIGIVGFINSKFICEQYTPTQFSECRRLLYRAYQSNNIKITGHNTKFDLKYLIHNNILTYHEACQIWSHDSSSLASIAVKDKIPDVWLARYEEQRKEINKGRKHAHRKAKGGSLKTLAPFHLGVEPFWEAEDFNNSKYNLLDCLYTYFLTGVLKEKINELEVEKCYNDLIMRAKVVMRAELDGISLNIPETKKRLIENEKEINELKNKIDEQWAPQFEKWRELQQDELKRNYEGMCVTQADKRGVDSTLLWEHKYKKLYEVAKNKTKFEFNLNSTNQMKWLLKDELGYDITGLDGEEAVDKQVLHLLNLKYPGIENLINYKLAKKLQSTYYPNLLDYAQFDGKVHCNFNITGAKTGRLSSSGPNLQNQPGHLHDLFIADPGYKLITKDLAALEPVLIAYYTEDKNLIDIVQSGVSFHSVNAKEVLNLSCSVEAVAKEHGLERKAAKEFGLSVLYGAGAERVRQTWMKYGFSFTINQCKDMVYRLRDYYKTVWAFKKKLDKVGESGQVIYNILGRPVFVQDKDKIYMNLFNSLIQGSGSDILMDSSVKMVEEYPGQVKPKLWVHDELVIQVANNFAQEFEKLMEKYMTEIDLTTSYGPVKLQVEGGISDVWQK